MKSKRWIFWLLAAANLAALCAFVSHLPDLVPTHFNVMGEADRWGSKWWMTPLGLLPILLLIGYEIYRKMGINLENRRYEDWVIPAISLMFAGISWIFALLSSGMPPTTLFAYIPILLGALMVCMSNIMGKIHPNRHFGLRIWWTLNDETVWRATHRAAGYWGVAGGACMIIIGLISLGRSAVLAFIGVMAGVALTILPPTFYAYKLYHKRHAK